MKGFAKEILEMEQKLAAKELPAEESKVKDPLPNFDEGYKVGGLFSQKA